MFNGFSRCHAERMCIRFFDKYIGSCHIVNFIFHLFILSYHKINRIQINAFNIGPSATRHKLVVSKTRAHFEKTNRCGMSTIVTHRSRVLCIGSRRIHSFDFYYISNGQCPRLHPIRIRNL